MFYITISFWLIFENFILSTIALILNLFSKSGRKFSIENKNKNFS